MTRHPTPPAPLFLLFCPFLLFSILAGGPILHPPPPLFLPRRLNYHNVYRSHIPACSAISVIPRSSVAIPRTSHDPMFTFFFFVSTSLKVGSFPLLLKCTVLLSFLVLGFLSASVSGSVCSLYATMLLLHPRFGPTHCFSPPLASPTTLSIGVRLSFAFPWSIHTPSTLVLWPHADFFCIVSILLLLVLLRGDRS